MSLLKKENATKTDVQILDLPEEIRDYYNALRDRLLLSFNGTAEPPRVIALTSCNAGEGVSTVSINLAVALSQHGKVLLVDANLESPTVHSIFEKSLTPGLVETLDEDSNALTYVSHNLDILTAGHLNGHRPRMFELPQKLAEIVEDYRKHYKFVVFDTPPINEASAAIRLAGVVDGVILVVESERTSSDSVKRAKEQMKQVKARMLGVVFNKQKSHIPNFLVRR